MPVDMLAQCILINDTPWTDWSIVVSAWLDSDSECTERSASLRRQPGKRGMQRRNRDAILVDVLLDDGFFVDPVDEVLTISKQQGSHDEVDGEGVSVVLIAEALARD